MQFTNSSTKKQVKKHRRDKKQKRKEPQAEGKKKNLRLLANLGAYRESAARILGWWDSQDKRKK